MTDERNIERLLKKRVEESIPGSMCLKFVSPGYTGVPDRMILLPGGAVVFVELKRPGEQPRQRQLFVQSKFRKLGFRVAGCVDSPEMVGQVVQMCMMISGQARLQMRKGEKNKGRSGAATQGAETGDGSGSVRR